MPRLAGEPTDPRMGGPVDELTQSVSGPHEYWVVKLDWLGPGRTGRAHLARRDELPDADARTRARYDESLPSDRISRLAAERGTLERLIDIADAIATGNRLAARLALEAVPGLADLDFPLGSRSAPSGWATAHIGPFPFDGTWRPGRKGHGTDWFALGRLWLAAAIDQRLNFSKTTVVADRGGIRSLDRATSLLEVIYRQLLQQLEQRPDFGFGRCAYCGGRVIRTRRPGPRANRWHPGCKETGRKRELRRRSTREVS